MSNVIKLALALCLAVALKPIHLFADADPIIVSGSAISTELDNIPGSVSVISKDDITQDGADFFQNQIIKLPNLNTVGGTARPRFFQIRGIGELEQYEGAPNSSVALIIDDVDLTGVSAALSLFDISQLELHRGPQAARFGSSALAGALYLSSEEPDKTTNGNGTFSFGNDELFSGGIAGNVQLTDNASLRLAGFAHQQDGFRDNEFLQRDDTNNREEYTGRVALKINPNPDTDITFRLLNVELNNGYDVFSIFNGFTTQTDQPGEDAETLRLGSLKLVTKVAEQTELTSISSYYETDADYSFDGDWGNNPFWEPFAPYDFFSDSNRERQVFAQQVRLGSSKNKKGVSWLSGLFYQNLNEQTEIREFSDGIEFDFLDSDYRADTLALFGSVDVPLAEKYSLSVGARVEHRDAQYSDNRDNVFAPDDTLVGGHVSLKYQASEDQSLYLLASRGFRGSGFNDSPSLSTQQREFSPESLVNLELGHNANFLEGNLKTRVAAFANFRRNQQIRLGLQIDPADPLSFAFLTDNAARGRSYGLEAEVEYLASRDFLINFSGSLLDTEITSADESIASLEGRDQAHAPNWQYHLGAEYFLDDNLSVQAGISGRDGFFFDNSHDQRSGSYQLINAGITYIYDDWEFRIWGRNLANKRYAIRGFFFGNEPPDFPETEYVQLGDPRSFGVTSTFRF